MSSVKFEGGKSKGNQQASAYLRHNAPTPENRARVKQAKEEAGEYCHIDTDKSRANYSLIMEADKAGKVVNITTNHGEEYGEAWARYKARLDEIDNSPLNTNKRRDRVTMLSLEIPTPEALSGEEQAERRREWFKGVARIIAEKYGVNNVVQCVVHEDETHAYIDAETHEERTSREHMHISIIPEKDGQLTCKWASKRSNIIAINKAVEDYTRTEFGEEFHTGTKKRSTAKINELKAESARLEEEARTAREKAKTERHELETAIKQQQTELQRLRREKQEAEDELQALKEAGARFGADIDINSVNADIEAIKTERKRLESTADKLTDFLLYTDTTPHGATVRKYFAQYEAGKKPEAGAGHLSIDKTVEAFERVKEANDRADIAAHMPVNVAEVLETIPAESGRRLYTEQDEAEKKALDERNRARLEQMRRMKFGAQKPADNAPEFGA